MNEKMTMSNKAKTFMPLLSGIIIALAVIFFSSGNAWAANASNETELATALSGTDSVIMLTGGITLTSDITVSRTVTISGGSLTLDTAGYSLVVDSGGNLTIDGDIAITGSGEQTIKVQNAGTFTLRCGDVISANETIWHSAIYIDGGGTVNIEGGTVVSDDNRSEGAIYANGEIVSVIVSGGEITGYSCGIKLFHYDSTSSRSTVTLSGGTITATAPETVAQTHGLWVEKGNVTITGDAEISAQFPVSVDVGSANISSGTFSGSVNFRNCPTVITGGTFGSLSIADTTTVSITGGIVLGGAYLDNCDTVEISGGTFTGPGDGINVSGCGDTAISGGTFGGAVGVGIYGVDPGKSVSISGDADITGTTYGVCGESCMLTITDDVTISGPYGLYLYNGCSAVISGGTITGNSYGSIFINGGALTLTGGTIINSRNETGYYGIYIQTGPADNRITSLEDLIINANAPLLYKVSSCFNSIPGPQTMAVGETKAVTLQGFDISTFIYTVDAINTSAELSASGTNNFSMAPTTAGNYNLVLSGRKSGESAFLTLTIPVSVVYSVAYDANGGTGAAPAKIYKDASETFTAAAAGIFAAPPGKQFGEWNTLADGSGTAYLAGATVTMPTNNLMLYAIWEDIPVTTYAASVSPTSKTFAGVMEGYSQQMAQTFTIANIGTGTITGLSAALTSGTHFDISTALSASSLNAGGTATVSVRPKTGIAVNAYTDTLTITGDNGISLTVSLSFTVNPVTTYTITFNSNGAVYTTKTANAGESIGSADWPPNPTRSSYTFGSWFTGENGAGTQFTSVTPVNATMTVYAKWMYSGGGESSSGGGSTTPTISTYNAEVNAGNGSSVRLSVTVDKSSGNASVDVGSGNNLLFEGKTTVITVPAIPDVDTYTLGIPVPSLSTQNEQGALVFSTDTGTITVPSNMLAGVEGISGSKAEISIGQGNKDNLNDDVKAAIGDKPLISLSLSIDGKRINWSNPNAPVTVSIPYTPTAAELANTENIVIWYIDGSGNVVTIPNGHYDAATGAVTFTTTHFSDYAVGYNKVSFNDVADTAWYNDAVGFIAARGITTGTGNGCYNPKAKLTRGEFIVMVMKAYGITPDESPTDNFSDTGSTYCTSYLATAKRLGISAGVGNNMFALGKEITRQEMFTLLYNALKVIDQLPQGNSGKTLSDFTDAGQIDSWAKDAVMLLVKTGTVGGSGGKLNPVNTTTRAEMARVLYNLLSK